MEAEFDTFLPIGTKEAKGGGDGAIFENYGRGVATSRDAWAYNFSRTAVSNNMRRTIETYNQHILRWQRLSSKPLIGNFVINDGKQISWSRDLKLDLQRGNLAEFEELKVREAVYRPFTKEFLFFDRIMNEEVYQFPHFLPNTKVERENWLICIPGIGNRKAFGVLATDRIVALDLAFEKVQCFPFYTYDEDGSHRRENITNWALAQFQDHYADPSIDKWAIFHYVYALLHHPAYREKYAANLRRALPRLPFAPDFHAFAQAGRALADLHVNYEAQPEYPLDWVETKGAKLSFAVHKMKLAKDKRSLRYNDFLTLAGLPPAVFAYKLGNRSALEWIIDRYQVSVDKRSGIVNDPNQYSDDPRYIIKLIGQVVHVSVETVKIVDGLSEMG